MYWWKQNQIDIQWSKLMCDQVPTPGRRHVADGWSMVRSQRWLIGYTFHHQKSYVVPTLGQPYQPSDWVAHVGPTWGERWHANCDVRPTMPTMYQRWINVLLLTGKCPVDLATAVEERNISQLDIKLQVRRLNML